MTTSKKYQTVIDQFRNAANEPAARAIAQGSGLRCAIRPPRVNGGGLDYSRLCGQLRARNGVVLCQSKAWSVVE
jgi:hypothetical protein